MGSEPSVSVAAFFYVSMIGLVGKDATYSGSLLLSHLDLCNRINQSLSKRTGQSVTHAASFDPVLTTVNMCRSIGDSTYLRGGGRSLLTLSLKGLLVVRGSLKMYIHMSTHRNLFIEVLRDESVKYLRK